MSFSRVLTVACIVCSLSGLARTCNADSWPGFRGAAGDGVSQETGIPSQWSETEGVAWSTAVRGVGNSSPAIAGDRIYLTSFDPTDESLWVIAIGRETGKVEWEKRVGQGGLIAYGPPDLYQHRHNPATASPCVDEEGNVYAFFGTGDLVCLDRDGNELWRHYIPDEYGPYDLKFGMAASPRLWGDTLYIACVHKGPSYVLALDRKTGKEAWLADRNYQAMGDATDAYTSPVVLLQADLAPQLIVTGCNHVDAYDLATGKRVWSDGSLVLPDEEYGRINASPTVGDGIVVVNSAKNQLSMAIQADGQGDITGSGRELWKGKGMADCPTATIHGGIIYSVRDDGVGTAFDLKTGKELWRQRVLAGRTQASPVVADGKVYFLALDGQCVVAKEGPTYEVVAKNTLPVGDFYATPAISDGMMFIRERSKLYGIGGSAVTVSKTTSAGEIDFEPSITFFQLPEGTELGPVSGAGTDDSGNIYLLQRQAPPVMCFDRTGKFLRSFGDELVGTGHGLAVDPDNNVWVTDTGHHLVFKFSPEGKLLLALGETDKPGDDEYHFNKPTHTAFGDNGDIFITDGYGNSRVVHVTADGKFVHAWGKAGAGPGEFNAPHAALIDKKGRLLICDRDNERIQIFNQQGELLDTWTGYKPFGVAMDNDGTLFICGNNKVSQLDENGKIVRSWGEEGVEVGQFKTPHLLAADKDGNLYAAEVGGRRLQRLQRVR